MAKRTRARILAVTLAAITLAGMPAVAHAQATDEPTGKQAARRPPTQSQVGEAWHQPQVTPATADVAGDARPHRPRARSESPGATSPTSPRGRPNRTGSPAGAWRRSGSWPRP